MSPVRYICPGIILLIWCLSSISLFPADQEPRSLVYDPLSLNQPPWMNSARAGNKLWEEGDEEGAIREWEKAVSEGFADGLAFYYLGRYYGRQNNWDKVITYLRKAKPRIEHDKEDPEVVRSLYEMLAMAYMKKRQYYESYIHYQKALRLDPDSPSLHLGLANLYLLRGRIDDAEKEAKQVLALSPSTARACWIMGAAAEKRGDYIGAVDYYRRFLAEEPDRWEARLSLGSLLNSQLQQTAAAEKELKKVVALAPNDPRAYAALGEIYLGRGQLESARESASHALKIDPSNYQALVIRGQIYLQEGESPRAEKYFKDALRVNPDGPLALYGLGVILFHRKEYQEAENHFRRAVNLAPHFREAALNRGLVLEVLGRRAEVLEQLRDVVERNPAFAPGHLALGRIYYYAGDIEKALPFFRNALALDRTSWEPYYFIGRCLFDRRENDEALEYYLAARERESENPVLLTDLALAYERAHQLNLAEAALTEALEADHNYLRALLKLGVLKARRQDSFAANRLYQQALIIKPGDINWGYQGEQRDFLVRMISGVEEYLGAGIDYLSLYAVMKNISRDQRIFTDLIPALKEKVRLHPLKPQYSHLLGMAYQEKGEQTNAEKYFLRAIRNDSDFAAAHLSLGQFYAQEGRYREAREHLNAVLSLVPESSLSPTIKEILKNLPE